jgi:N-acetyl-1-D-myo-inositol-2-amino-2-deoxy-alpha-D-glucopyranoside deacetylase
VLGVPFYVIDGATSKPGPVSVDPAPVADRKRAALLAHRSQVIVEGDSFSLAAGPVQPIAARESFTRLRPLGSDFADHGLPSRIAALLLAVILGAFAGMTLTVAHQASVTLGPFTVPWGIIAGLAITAALIAGLRLVFHTRLVALCAAVALLLVSGLLATQSLGGSVLVPANPAGYAWTFGPVLIVLVTLGWPRLVRQGQPRASGNIGTPAVKGPDLP